MLVALHREEGQGLTEYAIILSFIALLAIVALGVIGSSLSQMLSSVGSQI
jgi:Flp pilus assembly pilin Flp